MARKKKAAADVAATETLKGLRDALDLTLTRVMENDIDVDEARAVLAHLERELDALQAAGRRDRKNPAKPGRRKR